MGLRICDRNVVDIRADVPDGCFPSPLGLAMENRSRPAHEIATTESRHFAMIRQACHDNDPEAALTSLLIWIGISHHAQGTSSSEQFARDFGGHSLAEQIKVLRAARISGSAKWSGAALLGVLVETRGKLLSRSPNRPRQDRRHSESPF